MAHARIEIEPLGSSLAFAWEAKKHANHHSVAAIYHNRAGKCNTRNSDFWLLAVSQQRQAV
jgi:hypothetical protein